MYIYECVFVKYVCYCTLASQLVQSSTHSLRTYLWILYVYLCTHSDCSSLHTGCISLHTGCTVYILVVQSTYWLYSLHTGCTVYILVVQSTYWL